MNDRPPRDALEAGIRLGCGTIFGAAALLWFSFDALNVESPTYWILIGAGALVVGALAVRYGDRVYEVFSGLVGRRRF